MARSARWRRSLAVVAIFVAVGGVAEAEPIPVTSGGGFAFFDGGRTTFRFNGDGLTIVGFGFAGATTFFEVGTPGNLSGVFVFEPIFVGAPTQGVMIDGVLYEVRLEGKITFTSPDFIVPPPPADSLFTSFVAPFSLAGSVRGFTADGALAFDVSLSGAGTATAPFIRYLGGTQYVNVAGTQYDIEAAPPVPEPATIILFGTGLAGLSLRRRLGCRRAP